MPVFIYDDLSAVSGYTDNDISGTVGWVSTGGYLRNDINAEEGEFYKAIAGAGMTGNFEITFRMYEQSPIYNQLKTAVVTVSDGSKHFGIGIKRSTSGTVNVSSVYYTTNQLRFGTFDTGPNVHSSIVDAWVWFKATYTVSTGVWNIYYATGTSFPSSWTLSHSVTYAMGTNITRHGFYAHSNSTNVWYTRFDELTITEFGDTVEGFDASINFSTYDWRSSIAGGDNAHVFIANPFTSVAMSTIEDQGKRAITLYNKLGYPCFKGEVAILEASRDRVFYTVEEILRKLLYNLVNESPIIYQAVIGYISRSTVYAEGTGFVNNGVTTSHLANFIKADPRVQTKGVYSVTVVEDNFSTGYSPAHSEGAYTNLWFDNVALPDASNDYALKDDETILQSNTMRFVLNFTLYVSINSATALDTMGIELTMAGMSPDSFEASGSSHDYEIYAYNYSTTSWKKFKRLRKKDFSGAVTASLDSGDADRSRATLFIEDIESGIIEQDGTSNYSTTGAYNTGDNVVYNNRLWTALQTFDQTVIGTQYPFDGSTYWDLTIREYLSTSPTASGVFNEHTVNIAIQTAAFDHNPGFFTNAIWLFKLLLNAQTVDNNSPTNSTVAITTVNSDNIVCSSSPVTNFPEVQAYGTGDILIVSKKASDYLDDAFANSDLSNYFSIDYSLCTGITSLGLTEDYTNRPWIDLLEYIHANLNAMHYYDYSTDTLMIVSAGNHVSSTVTLTELDIVNFSLGAWSYVVDYTLEKTKLRVIGDNNVQPADADITPTHAFGLGDEWEVIEDLDIKTDGEAASIVTARSAILPKPKVVITFDLDFSKPLQANYSKLIVGKTAAVTITNVCDYSSGGTDGEELVIKSLEGKIGENDQELVTITLEARYS